MALGKLCLASEVLAKRCVPLLVQELRAAAAPAVRNNIMVALADLCIQVQSACTPTECPAASKIVLRSKVFRHKCWGGS